MRIGLILETAKRGYSGENDYMIININISKSLTKFFHLITWIV